MTVRVALTSGEPAGIGPELCVAIAQRELPCELVCLADRDLLASRAQQVGLPVTLRAYERPPERRQPAPQAAHERGSLSVCHIPLAAASTAGQLEVRNARYVLALLDRAIQGALSGEFAAIVTAPVHKGVINDAGVAFTGHTEYLAERTRTPQVVMLLAGGGLRVALATTHLSLARVPAAITRELVRSVLRILDADLQRRFGIARPRILVAGLNPHAGESGYLGREEIEVITPVIEELRAAGMHLEGPFPADTLFTPRVLARGDAVLAMFHDQGLPVLKHAAFGEAVNVTLGLPIIRTSVDHGTALDRAGTGEVDSGSLRAAIALAFEMAARKR